MNSDRFPFAREKVARAEHHIAELDREVEAYLARQPVIVVVDEWRQPRKYQLAQFNIVREALPVALVMVFGDAVHNLRSALDHLINEVVLERGLRPASVAFPFAKTLDSLGRQVREKMKDVPNEFRDVVRRIAPFQAGNASLWALHELDIEDKHRRILEINVSAVGPQGTVQGLPEEPHLVFKGLLPVPPEVDRQAPIRSNFVRLGLANSTEASIIINDRLPLGGMIAVDALCQLYGAVVDIISQFAALPDLRGPRPPSPPIEPGILTLG